MKTILITALTIFSLTLVKAQVPPVASNVKVLGTSYYNATPNPDQFTTLTGYYDYSGTNPEGTSTFQWYRSGVAIAGATSLRYDMQSADIATTITFRVTPKDNVPNTGTQVTSSNSLAGASSVATNFTASNSTDNTTQTRLNVVLNNNKYYTVTGAGVIVTIYGDVDGTNSGVINVTNGATLIIKGQLITNNNLDINVDANATFTIESGLDAKNGSILAINGVMNVTGNIVVEMNATFNINTGGSLAVTGNITTSGNAVLNIEGPVTVSGDVTVGSNAIINVDNSLPAGGTLTIGGDLTAGTGTTVNGIGPVSVAGTVSPAGLAADSQVNGGTLPIELVSFTATLDSQEVLLTWSTASETNNDNFMLERSGDAVHFENIMILKGAGNSSETNNYESIDKNSLTGVSYYRLKQTDYDGKFTYSKTISVNNKILNSLPNSISIVPNPCKLGQDNIEISLLPRFSKKLSLEIYNTLGAKIFSNEYELNQWEGVITIPAYEFPLRGTYYVVIQTEMGKITKKIMVE